MENRNDIELVRLSVFGDSRAFECLVGRHYEMVYRVAYKWCGVKEDAEDVAQEVCVKVARKLKTFRQKSSFKTWLYRITINTAKDFVKKRAAKSTLETPIADAPAGDNPGSAVENRIAAEQLRDALDRLPEKQKTAVLLVLGEGLRHKEAAKVMNCQEATVSWRIFQARKKLRKRLRRAL
jgi:RNA polymerase sigma-70 factor (ECF subfamily)